MQEVKIEKFRLVKCETVWGLLRRLLARLWSKIGREE